MGVLVRKLVTMKSIYSILILLLLVQYSESQISAKPQVTSYNQDEAKTLFTLSAGAYALNPEPCVARAFPVNSKYLLFNNHSETCDASGNPCSFYTVVSDIDHTIIIVFRGTKTKSQLLREGVSTLKDGVDFYGMGKVNKYFFKAHNILWDDVVKVFDVPQYKNYKLKITGHSLGGALASLAAMRSQIEGYKQSSDITIITFGEPRTGTYNWAMNYDRLIPKSYRVVNSMDVVPHSPACKKDKNSDRVKFVKDDSYPCLVNPGDFPYQHGTEIWYPTGMNSSDLFYECLGAPKNEDFDCSDQLSFELSKYSAYLADHRHYFDQKITAYGKLGEKKFIK
uniref:Lipase_3 domain-containing protein n=1 Tax=Rhabditophanes sp. KR3021 TaxID=114890 RepID=A0AC35TMR0_9BILA